MPAFKKPVKWSPLILFSLARKGINRYGALAGMLTGFGVTIAWKLGRNIGESPDAFRLVPWGAAIAGVALIIVGKLTHSMSRGDRFAVLFATLMTLCAWLLVPCWGLHHLYELVPAFALATVAALLVSRIADQLMPISRNR